MTEDSGLVEWVHHLTALRVAVQESLIAEGLWTHKHTNPAIKKMYEEFKACPTVVHPDGMLAPSLSSE